MPKYIVAFFLILIGLGSLAPSALAQGDPKDPPMPKGDKPSFGDRDDVVNQNKRFLKIRNETTETLNVFVQFRAMDNGAWAWIPGDPAKTSDALSVEIEAGKELDMQYKDEPVAASRMRIWATSPTTKWLKNKTSDVWLVPEKTEEGEHIYAASGVETFTFVFSSTKDKGVIPGDSDMVGEQGLPTEGENLPPPVPDIPWDVLPSPLPPDFPLVRDLAVLPVFSSGVNATVRVKNLGHFSTNLGRRLMIQKIAPGSVPEDKGPIGPLFHYSVKTFFLIGLAPGNYVAFISPGDDAPFHLNDKKPFSITAVAFSDVAVLPVNLFAGKVWIKVKNVGTAPLAPGKNLMVVKVPGGIPVDHGPIGALAVNDIKAFPGFVLPAGSYKAFVAPGDAPPFHANDQKFFNVPVGTFVDFDMLPVSVFAGKAHVKVKNIGTADAPAGSSLKIMKLPGGPPIDHGPIGPLPVNAVKLFAPIPLLPGSYKAFVSPGDLPPHHLNDSETFIVPGGAADLEAFTLNKLGGMVKGSVRNNGPGAYPGAARTWHLEKMMGGMWVAIPTMGSHVIPPLGPGVSHLVQGTFTGPGTYRLRITPGDTSPGNDVKTKLLP